MRSDDLDLPQPAANDRPSDLWVCGRTQDGQACSRGPTQRGRCVHADACQPRRTWTGRRRQCFVAVLGITTAAVLLWIGSHDASTFFKPGELTTPHAQILTGTATSAKCASCHANASNAGWFGLGWRDLGGDGHRGVQQTDRCLDCHHTTIDRQTARLAHNLPSAARQELRLAALTPRVHSWRDRLPAPAFGQDDVECSTCHREHRGADADLLAISDEQCQTCHADRFGDFAAEHPAWSDWPYGRGGKIAFDHNSHAEKHFPATLRDGTAVKFDCTVCHSRSADNEVARSTSFETACAACHDETLKVETAAGIDWVALPSLPRPVVEPIETWPEAATGFYDGKLSPLTALWMRSDSEAASAARLIPEGDFSKISAEDPQQQAAASTLAVAIQSMLDEIAREGQPAILRRIGNAGISSERTTAMIRTLPPQLFEDAARRWFGKTTGPPGDQAASIRSTPSAKVRAVDYQHNLLRHEDESKRADGSADEDADEWLLPPAASNSGDLLGADSLLSAPVGAEPLGADPLQTDPLLADPLQADPPGEQSARFDAALMLPAGGWYRDDLRLAIRYRGSGHADPVLKAIVETASELPESDSVRQELLATPAIKACISCHPSATDTTAAWRATPLIGRPASMHDQLSLDRLFTRFSHGPHLNIQTLGDCVHCHRLNSGHQQDQPIGPAVSATSAEVPPASNHEFLPLGKATCATCHTAQAAGDNCTKCHRYHVGETAPSLR